MPFMKGVPNPHGKVAYSQLSREEQLAYMREKNRASYLKKVGKLKRRSPLEMTDELRKQYYRDKANNRATRAKGARIRDDFTRFVTSEAHKLRGLREQLTGIQWHVDHVVPLKGKEVSGLHIWSNLAVIPKGDNLRKGNKNSVHDKW